MTCPILVGEQYVQQEECGLPSQRSIAIGKDEAYSRPATDAQGIGDPLDEGKAADESETREAARCGS